MYQTTICSSFTDLQLTICSTTLESLITFYPTGNDGIVRRKASVNLLSASIVSITVSTNVVSWKCTNEGKPAFRNKDNRLLADLRKQCKQWRSVARQAIEGYMAIEWCIRDILTGNSPALIRLWRMFIIFTCTSLLAYCTAQPNDRTGGSSYQCSNSSRYDKSFVVN